MVHDVGMTAGRSLEKSSAISWPLQPRIGTPGEEMEYFHVASIGSCDQWREVGADKLVDGPSEASLEKEEHYFLTAQVRYKSK